MDRLRDAAWVIVDADDTLWHDGRHYAHVDRCFIERGGSAAVEAIAHIYATVPAGERAYVAAILDAAAAIGVCDALLRSVCAAFLEHELELLPYVAEALEALAPRRIALVTKGPRSEQQAKLARSGLTFTDTLFVSRKDRDTWSEVFAHLGADPSHTIAIGNNLAEDIHPPHALGASTIWLNHPENPYRTGTPPAETWIVDGWPEILKEVTKR